MKDEYGDELGKIWKQADDAIDGYCISYYSAYDVSSDMGLPINNLDIMAFCGKIRFVGKSDWGGVEGLDYESPVVENPTWLELNVLANDCMLRTNDYHHCFFEGFDVVGQDERSAIGKFSLGS